MKKKDSLNLGGCRSLLNYARSWLDNYVNKHLEKSTVFKVFSPTIQNELIDCVIYAYRIKVISQVNKTPFIAVNTEVAVQNQLSTTIRYLHECQKIFVLLLAKKS